MPHPSRLLWRCRRGTREMDLLLEEFLRRIYPRLDERQQGHFEHFLEESDADIMDWLTGAAQPANPDYRPLVEQLQQLRPHGDSVD